MAIFEPSKWKKFDVDVPEFDKKLLVIWSDGDEVEYCDVKQLFDFLNCSSLNRQELGSKLIVPVLWSYLK